MQKKDGQDFKKEEKHMKKIGIIGAMELEVETLKEKMQVTTTQKKANMEFLEGTLNGVEVVIVRSGDRKSVV